MTVTVPIAGDRIVYGWGASVAGQLNKSFPLTLDADESTNSGAGSASNITGLTFPVVNGSSYRIEGAVEYSCANTNQGIGIGFRHPGGSAIGLFRATGPAGIEAETLDRIIEQSADTDEMTDFATVISGGALYMVELRVFYHCTADGTFAFRKQRNGTSGSTGLTLYAGSGVTVTVTG